MCTLLTMRKKAKTITLVIVGIHTKTTKIITIKTTLNAVATNKKTQTKTIVKEDAIDAVALDIGAGNKKGSLRLPNT